MIFFSLIITTILFIRFFVQIGIAWMGIIPVAIVVALFFGSGMQTSHKSGVKSYLEANLQSFSRLLILIWIQIILSLYNISRTQSSIRLVSINATLLGIMYLSQDEERQPALRSWIIFNSITYLVSGIYTLYLTGEIAPIVQLVGMLLALLGAFWSCYYFIIWHFLSILPGDKNTKAYRVLRDKTILYELILIYHRLIIVIIFQTYIHSDPIMGLILIQCYIVVVTWGIRKVKSAISQIHVAQSDIDVEYILRGYTINQIPKTIDSIRSIDAFLTHPKIQQYVHNIPSVIYSSLSISSITASIVLCGLIIYYGQQNNLNIGDFMMFLLNTGLYLSIFFLSKKIGIQVKLRRFFGFIIINISFFITVAQVFDGDNVSILFWSILRSTANNLALNMLQWLKSYLGKTDYQYRLMSNGFGLIIIIYFFLGLNLDILFKIAIVAMMIWLWLLLNKDNLKEVFRKE